MLAGDAGASKVKVTAHVASAETLAHCATGFVEAAEDTRKRNAAPDGDQVSRQELNANHRLVVAKSEIERLEKLVDEIEEGQPVTNSTANSGAGGNAGAGNVARRVRSWSTATASGSARAFLRSAHKALDKANKAHVKLRITSRRGRHGVEDASTVKIKEAVDKYTLAVAAVVRCVTMLAGALHEDQLRVAELVMLGDRPERTEVSARTWSLRLWQHRLFALQRQRKAMWSVTIQGHLGEPQSSSMALALCGDPVNTRHPITLPFTSRLARAVLALPTYPERVRVL